MNKYKNRFQKKYLIFLKILLLLLFFKILISKTIFINLKKNYENLTKINNTNIFYNQNYYKINGINYLNKCKKYLLSNNKTKFTNNIFPKISVIIPIYNCESTIQLSISSIQNQKFSDFEIILINDFSSDKSLQIIEKLQKEDNRIKIINNKINMGTLYSRCIGALKSTGKYILALDNDDLFINEKLFETIYNQAELINYDIIEFKSFSIKNYNPYIKDIKDSFFNHHPNNLILHQPELGIFPISKSNKLAPNDHWIWAKCIKGKLYKKSIHTLGAKRYSIYNCWTEDISIVFIIFNLAKSYIFLNIYGIFHLLSKSTTSYTLQNNHRLFCEIFLLDIIFDFSKNNKESKKYAVYKALSIRIYNFKILSLNFKIYLNSILKKLINCKYINNEDKQLITKKYKLIIDGKI